MKVIFLFQGSSTESGRAVVRRRLGAFLPLLASLPEVEVMVLSLIGKGDLHLELAQLGIPAATIAADPWRKLPGGTFRLAKLLRERNWDLIHASQPIPACVAGTATRIAMNRVPVAYFRHHEYGRRRLQVASRTAARLSDVTFVYSHAMADAASRLDRTDPQRIRVVQPGTASPRLVSHDEIVAAKNRLGIPLDAPVIGVVSRLSSKKGLAFLFEAMARLSDLDPLPHLVVAGDGPQFEELRSEALLILGKRAHFVGHHDDVALWFSIADIVAMPSLKEPFGFAAVEAMACQRPLVVSDTGGLPEAVGRDGAAILVSPADPLALSDGLRKLIVDRDLRLRMGVSAKERFERVFSLEAMARSMRDSWRWTLDQVRGS